MPLPVCSVLWFQSSCKKQFSIASIRFLILVNELPGDWSLGVLCGSFWPEMLAFGLNLALIVNGARFKLMLKLQFIKSLFQAGDSHIFMWI